jgi:hypothetical protein
LSASACLQSSARKKISADHFEAIAARFVAAEHESCDFERTFDNRQLALVELEVDDLPRFRFLPGQVSLDFPFEFLPGSSLALCT